MESLNCTHRQKNPGGAYSMCGAGFESWFDTQAPRPPTCTPTSTWGQCKSPAEPDDQSTSAGRADGAPEVRTVALHHRAEVADDRAGAASDAAEDCDVSADDSGLRIQAQVTYSQGEVTAGDLRAGRGAAGLGRRGRALVLIVLVVLGLGVVAAAGAFVWRRRGV